ncbi:hypothetical protein B0H13DRAFT_1889219 [Mycena leptocephala]|nr:hypothetical protein B0H13DRAFT_1889219 [Mycena leptocephala]
MSGLDPHQNIPVEILHVVLLSISPLVGKTLVQYSSSLTGRDFSAIAQVAPFVFDPGDFMAKMHLNWIEFEVARVHVRPCTITAPRFLPPSLWRYFFKLNAGNWRRTEAPCMRRSDELEVSIPADSRELEDSATGN